MDAIYLKPTEEKRVSKVGGLPTMPESIAWPVDESNKSIPFLCQLDLSEFKNEFANKGILYFFDNYNIMGGPIPTIYYDGNEKLEQRTIDESGDDEGVKRPIFEKEHFLEVCHDPALDDDGDVMWDYKNWGVQFLGTGIYVQDNIEEQFEKNLLLQVDGAFFEPALPDRDSVYGYFHFLISEEDLANKTIGEDNIDSLLI